jgi:hypothetical protein
LGSETAIDSAFAVFALASLLPADAPDSFSGNGLRALGGAGLPACGAVAEVFLLIALVATAFCGFVFFSFAVSLGVGFPFPINAPHLLKEF